MVEGFCIKAPVELDCQLSCIMTVITIWYSRLSKQKVTVTEVSRYTLHYKLFLKLRESTRNFSSLKKYVTRSLNDLERDMKKDLVNSDHS